MMPSPPPLFPWEQKPEDSDAASAEDENRLQPHMPTSAADLNCSAADRNTQPMPTLLNVSSPPTPARYDQAYLAEQQALTAFQITEQATQAFPGVLVNSPRSRPQGHTHRTGEATRCRRKARFQAPPWLLRLALLLGLAVLGVRAGATSATFMQPGGAIFGWSRVPVTHCVLCHLPQPTATQVDSQLLTPEQYAALLLPQLTLDEKLGQTMIVQFAGLQPTPDVVEMMNAEGVGGALLFEANIRSATQLRSLNAQLQQLSSIPPLLAVDQEGGMVNRLINIVGPLPPASSLKNPQDATTRGAQDAKFLYDFGFNLDLAPVVDVGTANPQLYERTFGSDPNRVAAMAGAYLEGLQQSGAITGTLKHFPGLGDTATDPHIGLPILTRSRADWESIDLAPYRTLLKNADVRAIMVTHELVRAVDSQLPASLSPALINGVLRGELAYNGVVITDSLYMGALNQRWSVPQAAVLAIKAGADMVIGPTNPQVVQQVLDALKKALNNGTLKQTTIDTAVRRILRLKIEMGLIPLPRQQNGQPLTPTPGGALSTMPAFVQRFSWAA